MNIIVKSSILYLIAGVIIFSTACKEPKEGILSLEESSKLSAIANNPNLDAEEKFHVLAETITLLLDEALAKEEDPLIKSHIKEFVEENKASLITIGRELDDWQKSLTDEERAFFMMKVITREYSSDLIKSVEEIQDRFEGDPEYHQLYNQLLGQIEMKR